MEISTWKWVDFPKWNTEKKLWNASFLGPWYDDSDPVGVGDTEDEAVNDALRIAGEMVQDLQNLIEKPVVSRGADQI